MADQQNQTMKIAITILFIGIVSVCKAQVKQLQKTIWQDSISTSSYLKSDINHFNTMQAASVVFMLGGQKPVMTVSLKKEGKQVQLSEHWDIIELKISKKDFHWLNDSTAVIIKR